MFSTKLARNLAIVLTGALYAGSVALAATNNPLHPSYFVDKVGEIKSVQVNSAMSYSDTNNPLHPSFKWTNNMQWEAAVNLSAAGYVDHGNPLHPSYQR